MSDQIKQLSPDFLMKWRNPIWDPPPDWMLTIFERDPELLRKFTAFEAEFMAREFEFQAEKMREFGKMFG